MKIYKYKVPKITTLNTFLSFILSTLLLSYSVNTLAAEYVYISDNLRVGVRTEPVSGIPPIGVVFTGMRLKVHEKSEGYIKITTDKGLTGWIKDIYVTKKAPAIIQLNNFQIKYKKLEKELAENKETTALLEKANAALNEQLIELKEERREWSRERATLLASQYRDSSWFGIAIAVILIILSFVGGIFWYKTQVMKRLGGLRV